MLLAILLYVALDLCLPAMPGAFVFESAESVESARIARGRPGTAVTSPARDLSALSPRRLETRGRVAPVRTTSRVARPSPVSRALRATVDPPPASEEPH